MTKKLKQKIIVILGMHRSGTSAIARALKVFNIGLGNNLMPPLEGNNPTGFWEDLDIYALNEEMLRTIGDEWHHLSPINQNDVSILRKAGFFSRASKLLREKIGDDAYFGFKDPRTAKLLPFWKLVFSRCGFDIGYVIALRHPSSVASSLGRRDGFEPGKSYVLWLAHILASLTNTNKCQRIIIDYDRLIANTDREINRLAAGLMLSVDQAELARYKSEFLDVSLRHSFLTLDELKKDAACPPLVQDIFPELVAVAADKLSMEEKTFQQNLAKWQQEFARDERFLNLADEIVANKEASIAQTIAYRDAQIKALTDQLNFLSDHNPQRCELTLYLGSEAYQSAFGEADKVAKAFELSGKIVTIEIDIPSRPEPYSRLRLDPADCPCILELESIELCTLAGDVFWEAIKPANCFIELNDQILVILNPQVLAWILSSGIDPNLELVFPQETLALLSKNGGKLRLKLRGRRVGDVAELAAQDFRLLLRNEVDQLQHVAEISNTLSAKMDEKDQRWEKWATWHDAGAAREQQLLAKISTLETLSASRQAALLVDQVKTSEAIVALAAREQHLLAKISTLETQSASHQAALQVDQVKTSEAIEALNGQVMSANANLQLMFVDATTKIAQRDSIIDELEQRLTAVQQNAQQQLLQRDSALAHLSQKLSEVSANAEAQHENQRLLAANMGQELKIVAQSAADTATEHDLLIKELIGKLNEIKAAVNTETEQRDALDIRLEERLRATAQDISEQLTCRDKLFTSLMQQYEAIKANVVVEIDRRNSQWSSLERRLDLIDIDRAQQYNAIKAKVAMEIDQSNSQRSKLETRLNLLEQHANNADDQTNRRGTQLDELESRIDHLTDNANAKIDRGVSLISDLGLRLQVIENQTESIINDMRQQFAATKLSAESRHALSDSTMSSFVQRLKIAESLLNDRRALLRRIFFDMKKTGMN